MGVHMKAGLDNEKLDVVNPIITVRKERPPGRVKSAVEIQDKESRRHCLKSIDLNVQKGGNETQLGNSRDNRKTCQNCGQKGITVQPVNLLVKKYLEVT
ncbi:unnamed protein product [Rhizophagus irregularis]|nr:unnamed protein product [Rhizophagus irregularis]